MIFRFKITFGDISYAVNFDGGITEESYDQGNAWESAG